MKGFIKHVLNIFFCCLLGLILCACKDNETEATTDTSNWSQISPIEYNNIPIVEDIDAYQAEVRKNGTNNDDPVENGIVNCPYYTLTINNQVVPVYSTRCAQGVHSFAWIDIVNVESAVLLNVELKLNKKHEKVVVLPESSGVVATMEDKVVTAQITSYGSFSFAFDRKVEEALTIYVAKEEKLNVPREYEKVTYQPGTYSSEDTNFTEKNRVYYFEKGVYNISSIHLPSNSILYFESGTYVNVVPESPTDNKAAIRSSGTVNIEVAGRALFDFSRSQGGDAKIKGVFSFHNIDTARYSGIITINSNSWSVCFTDCNDILVEHNMILGYRTYSDGIMLSDCQDSLVRYNFVRTGDDAIEAKSTGSEQTENLIYEYNDVWTDKARAYGCIYEANHAMNNVVFRNNSVGFSLATWSDRLGCCVIAMGDRRTTMWENIHFENIEIYMSYNALINVTLEDDLSNGTDGGKARELYFENINAYRAYGYAVFINVQSGSSLGKVYLDNIQYNGKTLLKADLNNKDEVSITHYSSSWSKDVNIKVNTIVNVE